MLPSAPGTRLPPLSSARAGVVVLWGCLSLARRRLAARRPPSHRCATALPAGPPPPPLPPAACRLAAQPQLGALRSGLASFLKHKVGPWLAAREGGEEVTALLQGVRAVERALGGKA